MPVVGVQTHPRARRAHLSKLDRFSETPQFWVSLKSTFEAAFCDASNTFLFERLAANEYSLTRRSAIRPFTPLPTVQKSRDMSARREQAARRGNCGSRLARANCGLPRAPPQPIFAFVSCSGGARIELCLGGGRAFAPDAASRRRCRRHSPGQLGLRPFSLGLRVRLELAFLGRASPGCRGLR